MLVSVKYSCIPTVCVCVCVQEFLALVEENDALQRKMAVSTSYHMQLLWISPNESV